MDRFLKAARERPVLVACAVAATLGAGALLVQVRRARGALRVVRARAVAHRDGPSSLQSCRTSASGAARSGSSGSTTKLPCRCAMLATRDRHRSLNFIRCCRICIPQSQARSPLRARVLLFLSISAARAPGASGRHPRRARRGAAHARGGARREPGVRRPGARVGELGGRGERGADAAARRSGMLTCERRGSRPFV
jgi:hypothetical protein